MDLEGKEIEGDIIRLAFGGMGVMRYEGLVVFVPFTAPGERVKVEVSKQHKNFAEGRLIEVLQASERRCKPLCPYFGRCGGCQLQHLEYPTQVEQKQHFVEDAFVRIGKLTLPQPVKMVAAEHMWAYRRHIRLTLFALNDTYEVGYVGIDDVELVAVQQCPIFSDGDDSIIRYVSELAKKLVFVGDLRAHISVIKDGSGHYVIYVDFAGAVPVNVDHVLKDAVERAGPIVGAVWRAGERGGSHGKTLCHFQIGTLRIAYSPTVFVQSHPEQSEHIYHQIEVLVKECKAKRVLDLYCGIGVTSLLLAKQGIHVVGVEANPDAVLLAKQNAQENHCTDVTFERADVTKAIRRILKQAYDLVILNPPRTGTEAHTLEAIAHRAPKYVIYVSCMPATLARDLALLCKRGYEIATSRAYDMFPQTTHVETVVLLKHKGASYDKP